MDFFSLLGSYVDVGSVLAAVIFTHLIRYFLPAPKGDKSKFGVGPIAYRCLPFFPLLIGVATVVIKDGLITPTLSIDEAIVKGLVSGGAAAYLFRTLKVVIFGSQQAPNGKEEIATDEAKGLIDKAKELLK